jgi:hypothetical protein
MMLGTTNIKFSPILALGCVLFITTRLSDKIADERMVCGFDPFWAWCTYALCAPWSVTKLKEQTYTCTCIHFECFRSCDIFKFRDWWGVNLVPDTFESCLSCFVFCLKLHFLPVRFDTPQSALFPYLFYVTLFLPIDFTILISWYAFSSTLSPYLFYVPLFLPLCFPTLVSCYAFSSTLFPYPFLCSTFPSTLFSYLSFLLCFFLHFISLRVLC